ncbi:DNA packaging protein [Burkholderia sp. Bp8990]|nr:DNA packaging protein [Burkholderia sp. Bp8990]
MTPNAALVSVLNELKRRQDRNKLARYAPYQKQRDFHNASAQYRERLFMAGNQLGKTWSSAYEIAYHLTGKYPDWWQGKRWNRAVTGWALGESMESTRDTLQRLVLGRPGEWGTGTIPADCIIGDPKRAQGVADCVDMVMVRHAGGGVSRLYFKSYEKGRTKLQGETIDFAALDEEPPLDIYTEVLTRTNATKGIVWITFTPLLGMSLVVQRFLMETNDDRNVTRMTIRDVGHYTKEEIERIEASYPEHERKARANGEPVLGDGAVYPIEESLIKVDPFPLPDLWPRVAGIDFGWDHPTALVWTAWDRDKDITYVYDVVTARKQTPNQIAPLVLNRGDWIPVAWPHDGLQTEKGSGVQLADQYRDEKVFMLHERAQYPETGDEEGAKVSRSSVEAGITDILTAMQLGKFKVFSHLNEWFSEFRMYHRKNGKIVKLQDDVMDATRYARMMQRYAETPPKPRQIAKARREYDWRAG